MQALIQTLSVIPLLLWCVVATAVMPNEPAPAFERVPLHGGQPISLEAYRGKVVVVDFWASWCGPCRKSMPFLNELRQQHHGKGFEVLAVNLDARVDEALRFLRDYPVDYPVVHDNGRLPELYGVPGMPTSYYIDRRGIVRFIHIGFDNSDKSDVRKVVLDLLEEKDEKHVQP